MADDRRNLVLSITANTRAAVAGMDKFVKSLKDTESGAGKTNRALGQARQAMAQYVATVQQSALKYSQAMRQQVAGGTERAVAQAKKALQTLAPVAEKSFAAVRVAAAGARMAISAMLGPLGNVLRMGGALGAVFGGSLVAGLGAFAKRGVDVNLSLQKAEGTFTQLFKSAKTARDFMAALQKEAASSSFEFVGLAQHSETLAAFGFQAGQIIPVLRTLGDVARGDGEKLSRLVMAIGQIKAKGVLQGEEALQLTEAGVPVRQYLGAQPGKDIADLGLTGDQGIARILAGMQRDFGGLQAAATQTLPGRISNISDALNSITSGATKGLLENLRQAAGTVLGFLNNLEKSQAGQAVLKTIEVLLNGVGRAAQQAAKQMEPFLNWLSKVATADNVVLLLSNVLALIQTLGGQVLKLFGVDLKKALDPKNVTAWFEALGTATASAINSGFGMARVFKEAGRMIQSAIQDAGDHLRDFGKDAEYVFRSMLLSVQASIHSISISMLESVQAILEGLNRLKWPNGKPVFDFDTKGVLDARLGAEGRRDRSLEESGRLNKDYYEDQQFRNRRNQQRMAEDPFRGQDPGKRIGDAFAGRGRDTSAQKAFWDDFARNRMGIVKGLFAGATAQVPVSPTGAGIQLFGSTPRGAASVQSYRLGPGTSLPRVNPNAGLDLEGLRARADYLRKTYEIRAGQGDPRAAQLQADLAETLRVLNNALGAAAASKTGSDHWKLSTEQNEVQAEFASLRKQFPAPPNSDPFAPIRLPDGRVVSPFAPEARGLSPSGAAGVNVTSGRNASGSTYNFTIQGVQTWDQVKQMFLRWLDEEERKSNPGASMAFP